MGEMEDMNYSRKRLLQWAASTSKLKCRSFEDLKDCVVLLRILSHTWRRHSHFKKLSYNTRPRTPANRRDNWKTFAMSLRAVELPIEDAGLNLIGVQNGSPECCLDLPIMLFYIQKMTEPGVDVRLFDFTECHSGRTVPFRQQLAELGILNSNGANVLKAHQEALQTEQEHREAVSSANNQYFDGMDANDAVLEVEGQQDYIVEMELCMKELEQKLRVQSRQVQMLELQKELEKQRCVREVQQLTQEHQAEMQLAARNSASELEVAGLLAAKAQVKLSEEFDARVSKLEEEGRGHSDELGTEIEDVQEIAELRHRCSCQAARIEAHGQSMEELKIQLKQMAAHIHKEEENSRQMCSRLFDRQDADPEDDWMEGLSGIQLARAMAMKQQIAQLQLAEQSAVAKHQAAVQAAEVLKLQIHSSSPCRISKAAASTPGSDKRTKLAHSSSSPSSSPRRFEIAELASA